MGVVLFSADMRSAQAGPLIDWLFGRRTEPAYPVGSPVPIGNAAGYAPYTSGYAPAYSAYSPGYPNSPTFSAPGYAPPAGVGYVPGTPTTYSNVPSFRTNYYRAPVTYYRPVLATDPSTGAQTVRMSPCTSYEYQTQRVPTLGQSVYYGNYSAPVAIPAPAAGPTYTLPQGGIPLSRSLTPPMTTRSYGAYTTLQPGVASGVPAVQPGQYQTNPYGTTPYYGSTTGGCTGSTVAPQGYTAPPSYSTPPGLTAPPSPLTAPATGVYPPSIQTPAPQSGDPADVRPALPTSASGEMRSIAPTTNTRSQLKHITQAERGNSQSTAAQDYQPPRLQSKPPAMRPIPVPSDFDADQHWTPGLLRDEDLTAQAQPQPRVDLAVATAGQGKRIQWASFDEAAKPRHVSKQELEPLPHRSGDYDGSATLRLRRLAAPAPAVNPPEAAPSAIKQPVLEPAYVPPSGYLPRRETIIRQPAASRQSSTPRQTGGQRGDRYQRVNWEAVR
ncbi:MAG: hypothetical protein Aurels2KO_48510 [Aureliella sp.]